MSILLRWPLEQSATPAGDGRWRPSVEMVNSGTEVEESQGAYSVTGVLLDPAGHPVQSRQSQPYPMPAALRLYRLKPQQVVALDVGLSLLSDEIAALTPGNYRVTRVTWGGRTAPDLEVVFYPPELAGLFTATGNGS